MDDACIITIRDFLTDKHGFTLPDSRLSSYDATIKHTHLSLFRNPKAFNVHLHLFLHSNNCADDLVDKDGWERGEYAKVGHVTLWAHFDRIPGVDMFGEPRRREKMLEVYSFPPPSLSALAYFPKDVEIVPVRGRGDEVSLGLSLFLGRRWILTGLQGFTKSKRTEAAPHFPGFRNSTAARVKKSMPPRPRPCKSIEKAWSASKPIKPAAPPSHARSAAQSIREVSRPYQPTRRISESPLFEPELEIKKECSPSIFQDEGGIEWTDECYGSGNCA